MSDTDTDLTASPRIQKAIRRLVEYVEAQEKPKLSGVEVDDPRFGDFNTAGRVSEWLDGLDLGDDE
jgi:hypothetical protein